MRTVLTTRANGRYAGLWIGALALLASATASAQVPRINTLFPIGGRAGSTVEVEMRGASLDGANVVLVDSKGLSGTVAPGGAKVDQTFKPLWQAKCGNC